MSEPSSLASRDLREVENASNFAIARGEDMTNAIDRVNNMGSFRLWWDSKVPENEKSFFNRISWSSSDPEALRNTIKRYRDFYDEMRDVIKEVHDGAEDTDELVQELYEKLLEMRVESEHGITSTNSKTLYDLHQDFVEKHQLLESKIKRVEVVAVRQQLKSVKANWEKAVADMNSLTEKFENSCRINKEQADRFDKLMTVNEQLAARLQELTDENTLIKTLLKELIERGPGGSGTDE